MDAALGFPALVALIAIALLFDMLNGLHDAANSIATVVSSYLGETSRNLAAIFDFCSRGSWVVLFDEFDALAKERADSSEHGELKRVVTAFLQLLDEFHGRSLILAATNHPDLMDDA